MQPAQCSRAEATSATTGLGGAHPIRMPEGYSSPAPLPKLFHVVINDDQPASIGLPVLHSYRRSTTVLGKGARAWGPAAWGGLAGGRRWLSLPSCSYPSHDDDRSNTLPAPRSGQPAQTIFTSSGHRRHAISSHPQTCVSLACWPKSLGLRNNITSPRPPQPPTGAKNQYGYGTVQCCIHTLRQQAGDGLPAPAPLFCATPAAVQIRLPSTPRLLLCLTRTWHNTAGSVLSNTSTEEASHSGWARGPPRRPGLPRDWPATAPVFKPSVPPLPPINPRPPRRLPARKEPLSYCPAAGRLQAKNKQRATGNESFSYHPGVACLRPAVAPSYSPASPFPAAQSPARAEVEPRGRLRRGEYTPAPPMETRRAEPGAGRALDANANGDAPWTIPGKLRALSSWALAPSLPTGPPQSSASMPAGCLAPRHFLSPRLVLIISRLTNVMH
ncbi:hypothetical protein ACCO45_002682 [Purpureocillium lilacinum]|uniref:Uncharacterized protein n=1 Tax=Purpureocillium lilacinum TaxID=33203 RepID=A0ACC4ECJ4_PURLI